MATKRSGHLVGTQNEVTWWGDATIMKDNETDYLLKYPVHDQPV